MNTSLKSEIGTLNALLVCFRKKTNLLRKLLAISLLALFIGNMIGPFVVFKIEQAFTRKAIKLQIKAGIPEDDLHEFNLSATAYKALDWVRLEKEFRLGNEMFDIVRAETLGNTIHLYCVNDKEEALLFAQLDEITQKKMEQESHAPNSPVAKAVKLLKLVYVSFNNKEVLTGFYENLKQHFSGVKPLYSSPFLRVPSPPPNII